MKEIWPYGVGIKDKLIIAGFVESDEEGIIILDGQTFFKTQVVRFTNHKEALRLFYRLNSD